MIASLQLLSAETSATIPMAHFAGPIPASAVRRSAVPKPSSQCQKRLSRWRSNTMPANVENLLPLADCLADPEPAAGEDDVCQPVEHEKHEQHEQDKGDRQVAEGYYCLLGCVPEITKVSQL